MSLPICSRATIDSALGLPAERMVAAGRVTELLGEVRQHRLDHPRIHGRGRLRVHEDRELQRHPALSVSRWCVPCFTRSTEPRARLARSARPGSSLSSSWLIAAWIFCTGRLRLQRAICGHSLSSRQLTMLIGPSSARTTSPDRDVAGVPRQHVSALRPVLADDQPTAWRGAEGSSPSSSGGILNSSAIRLALTAPEAIVRGDVVDRHQPVVRRAS